jgi:hypothetical protein
MRTQLARHTPAVVLSLAAVLLLTWPMATQLTTALPYASGDGLENAWNIWWAKEALVVRRVWPFWTAMLYQPHGTSLLFHALGLAAAPVAIPLQLMVDPPTALVVTLLALLWLTALTTYWLVWDIVHHRAAALVAGLFVALAPAHLYHLHMGQLNLTALYPVPLILVGVRRAQRRRQWRWVALGALGVVLCALADWQYLVVALLLAGVLVLAEAWQRRRHPAAARAYVIWGGLPLAAGLALLLPLVVAMAADLRGADDYATRPLWQAERRSVDLAALLTPNPFHPLWGTTAWHLYEQYHPLTNQAGERLPGRPTLVNVSVASLSVVALALAAIALWRRPRPWPWLMVLGLATLMALGPTLHVYGISTDIALPYTSFWSLPYMNISRTPAVFMKVGLLALGVLLAFGLRRLTARLGRQRFGQLALLGATGLLVVENLAAPLDLPTRPAASSCYQVLASDLRPGAVLDLPVANADEPMYFQILHGRPIFGGDLSRDNPYPLLFETPVLTQLARADRRVPQDIYLGAPGPDRQAHLAGWGVSWLMVRRQEQRGQEFERALTSQLGPMEPVCADDLGLLYHLEPRPTVLTLDGGWHDLEQDRTAGAFRWLGDAARLTAAMPAAGPATLRLSAWAHQQPRTIEVWVNDERQARLTVPTGAPVALSSVLRLPAGSSTLELRASPSATVGGPNDPRPLTVAIAGLSLDDAP